MIRYNAAELLRIKTAAQLAARALEATAVSAQEGMSTKDVDAVAARFIKQHDAKASFLGYRGYPASLCTSIDSVVVHGIPSPHCKLVKGALLSLDIGTNVDGFFGDTAMTIIVGSQNDPEKQRLIKTTRECLFAGIKQCVVGNRIGDISNAVQVHAEKNGYNVVRDYVGHGIGRSMHEDPQVPNYGNPGEGVRLKSGMCICIEPMLTVGSWQIKVLDDEWTVVTADGSLSCHFEHQVAILSDGPEVLTLRSDEV